MLLLLVAVGACSADVIQDGAESASTLEAVTEGATTQPTATPTPQPTATPPPTPTAIPPTATPTATPLGAAESHQLFPDKLFSDGEQFLRWVPYTIRDSNNDRTYHQNLLRSPDGRAWSEGTSTEVPETDGAIGVAWLGERYVLFSEDPPQETRDLVTWQPVPIPPLDVQEPRGGVQWRERYLPIGDVGIRIDSVLVDADGAPLSADEKSRYRAIGQPLEVTRIALLAEDRAPTIYRALDTGLPLRAILATDDGILAVAGDPGNTMAMVLDNEGWSPPIFFDTSGFDSDASLDGLRASGINLYATDIGPPGTNTVELLVSPDLGETWSVAATIEEIPRYADHLDFTFDAHPDTGVAIGMGSLNGTVFHARDGLNFEKVAEISGSSRPAVEAVLLGSSELLYTSIDGDITVDLPFPPPRNGSSVTTTSKPFTYSIVDLPAE